MNNFDIKDCPNINHNQEEAIYETERINEFMGVLKGELEFIGKSKFNFLYSKI